MKKGIFFLIAVCLCLLACQQTELENKLTKKDSFWYIFVPTEEVDLYENFNYGYKFFPNGKLDYMGFNFRTKMLESYRDDDVIFNSTWEDKGQKKIKIKHREYNIIKDIADTLFLEDIKINKKLILINLKNKNPEILRIYNVR